MTDYDTHNFRDKRVVLAISSKVSIHYVGEGAWQDRGVQTMAARKQSGQWHRGPGRGMSPRNAFQPAEPLSPSSIPHPVIFKILNPAGDWALLRTSRPHRLWKCPPETRRSVPSQSLMWSLIQPRRSTSTITIKKSFSVNQLPSLYIQQPNGFSHPHKASSLTGTWLSDRAHGCQPLRSRPSTGNRSSDLSKKRWALRIVTKGPLFCHQTNVTYQAPF